MFSKARQLGDTKEGQDYKICLMKNLKVVTRDKKRQVFEFDKDRYVLFVREKICLAKANIQARCESKMLIPNESLTSYLVSTPDCFGKTS